MSVQLPDSTLKLTHTNGTRGSLPLVVGPSRSERAAELSAWIERNRGWFERTLSDVGAVLFRGFGPDGAQGFEAVARACSPDLQNNYMGTSPRENLTPYVFTASELPEYFPIPQHAEMSFVANPPQRLFFCALRASDGVGGETPLCDLRAVYDAVDPAVRQRFIDRGVRIIRNYGPPGQAKRRDPWQLKTWDAIFGTTDRAQVEEACATEGFAPTWGADGGLRLVSEQPAARLHAPSGRMAWFNHAQVFHLHAAALELARIARFRPSPRAVATWLFADASTRLRGRTRSPEEQAMHCTFADGSEISRADLSAVVDAFWANLAVVPWQTGDMLAIDNRAVSHGRLPYRGPRVVAVAWS